MPGSSNAQSLVLLISEHPELFAHISMELNHFSADVELGGPHAGAFGRRGVRY